MGHAKKTGIARLLAILSMFMLTPVAQAHDLTLPKASSDPVTLHVLQGPIENDMLKVFLEGAETPIAGHYAVADNALHFVPAFGFEPGQDYVAKIGSGDQSQVPFRLPDGRMRGPAVVTKIFPSGDALPENILRFYIHFSVPMQPQVAFDYIKLRDASGIVDEAAFMQFKQELWNESRTRLTILIDPGRIKRQVATNIELGPALRAGQRYTLVVEDGWPSADGASFLPAFTKTFHVSDPLRSLPEVSHWSTNLPCLGTRAPLTVAFDRPFDRHLLMSSLRVRTGQGDVIEGEINVKTEEQVWRFIPTHPWSSEHLQLIAETTLEDVAGNNFHDLLDHVAGQDKSDAANSVLLINTRNCTG